MDNSGYDISGISLFNINPVDTAINENQDTVKVYGNQTIGGNKVFTGTVTIEDEIIHNSTSFSTEDGIIEQLKGNTGDMLDYGNYGVYNDGVSTKYKGIINKKQTDKFYVFHNQTNQPVSSLNLGTQNLGSLVVRDPVENNEVATKQYVESHGGGSYLPLSGGTLSGNVNMGNNEINNLKDLRFGDVEVYNDIIFPVSNRLTIGEHGDNFFMHFNAIGANELIEIMKETNVHGDINMLNAKRIFGLLNPISNDEPANKAYTDTKLSLTGGSLTGDLSLAGNNLFNANEINLVGNNGRFVYFTSGVGAGTNIQTAQANNTLYFSRHASTDKTLNINTLTKLCSFFGNIDMNNKHIINVADGTNGDNAVNKNQLDTKLNLTGGTMSGQLDFSNDITMTTPISGNGKIRIGLGGAPSNKGNNTVAIGSYSGQENQGMGAVAIGAAAGFGSQGANAIAIGNLAGYTGSNGTTSQASNSILLNATGTNYTTGQTNSFNVKPIRNLSSNNNILKYDPSSGEITHDVATSGETIRYINNTITGFNPTGVSESFVTTFDPIPNGDYYFDINVTVKYTANNANADGFTFIMNPSYVVNPGGIDYGVNLEMNNVSISSSNNTYGSKSLKWFDTRTSTDNNSSLTVILSYNGGGALNFDVNVRGTIKKI